MAATKLIKNRTTKTAPTETGKLTITAKFTYGAGEIFINIFLLRHGNAIFYQSLIHEYKVISH